MRLDYVMALIILFGPWLQYRAISSLIIRPGGKADCDFFDTLLVCVQRKNLKA